jgi:predicted ATPase/DNA-binding XRE family transcriptional regulator
MATMSQTPPAFGDLLRRLRSAAGLSQDDLAERSGVSRNGISDLERGLYRTPRFETVRLLADGLGLGAEARVALVAAARPAREQHTHPPGVIRPQGGMPVPLTRLIGREAEVAALRALLRDEEVRLLTVTGPGGVGKTRLAIAAAKDLGADFPGGVVFVGLAPVRDGELVVSAIAQALGVGESAADAVLTTLIATLGSAEALLVLDNVEHVLDAAPLVGALLAACPGLKVLVTSRAALRVSGERVYPVPPLTLPNVDDSAAASVGKAPAVRLYVERAAAVDPGFVLTDDNAAVVAAICQRLDGLPLAIELAAARSNVLSPAHLWPRLARQLPLLTGGPRDVPARLRTMENAIAWSYDLLTPDEQRLFRRLAVFVGGFALPVADAIAGDLDADALDVLTGVGTLVDQSLLRRLDAAGAEPRFGMLEPIREFALDKLAASGEEPAIRDRHADYYGALAERAEPHVRGPDQVRWIAQLEAELPNLRATMSWLRESGRTEHGLGVAMALAWFLYRRNHVREARQWLTVFLADPQGDATLRAAALSRVAAFDVWCGDHRAASECSAQSLALWRRLGDRTGMAIALRDRGGVMMGAGDYAKAGEVFSESLRLFADLDAPWDMGLLLEWFGILCFAREDYALAIGHFQRAMTLFTQTGDTAFANWMRGNVGWVALIAHDDALARSALAESLAVAWDLGDAWWVGWCLMGAGGLATRQDAHDQAARLFGASEALRRTGMHPLLPAVQAKYNGLADACRTAMGDAAWSAEFEAGMRMPLTEAVAAARAVLETVPVANPS